MSEYDKRGTGRTTGLILMTIAKAVLHRGEMVEFIDHYRSNYADAKRHKAIIRGTCDVLGLKNMDIKIVRNNVFIVSKFKTESEA